MADPDFILRSDAIPQEMRRKLDRQGYRNERHEERGRDGRSYSFYAFTVPRDRTDIVDAVMEAWRASYADRPAILGDLVPKGGAEGFKRLGATAVYDPLRVFAGWSFPSARADVAAAVAQIVAGPEITDPAARFVRDKLKDLGAVYIDRPGEKGWSVLPNASLDMDERAQRLEAAIAEVGRARNLDGQQLEIAQRQAAFLIDLGLSHEAFGRAVSLSDLAAVPREDLYNALKLGQARYSDLISEDETKIVHVDGTPYKSLLSAAKAELGIKRADASLADVAANVVDTRERAQSGPYSAGGDELAMEAATGRSVRISRTLIEAARSITDASGIDCPQIIEATIPEALVMRGPIVAESPHFVYQSVVKPGRSGAQLDFAVHSKLRFLDGAPSLGEDVAITQHLNTLVSVGPDDVRKLAHLPPERAAREVRIVAIERLVAADYEGLEAIVAARREAAHGTTAEQRATERTLLIDAGHAAWKAIENSPRVPSEITFSDERRAIVGTIVAVSGSAVLVQSRDTPREFHAFDVRQASPGMDNTRLARFYMTHDDEKTGRPFEMTFSSSQGFLVMAKGDWAKNPLGLDAYHLDKSRTPHRAAAYEDDRTPAGTVQSDERERVNALLSRGVQIVADRHNINVRAIVDEQHAIDPDFSEFQAFSRAGIFTHKASMSAAASRGEMSRAYTAMAGENRSKGAGAYNLSLVDLSRLAWMRGEVVAMDDRTFVVATRDEETQAMHVTAIDHLRNEILRVKGTEGRNGFGLERRLATGDTIEIGQLESGEHKIEIIDLEIERKLALTADIRARAAIETISTAKLTLQKQLTLQAIEQAGWAAPEIRLDSLSVEGRYTGRIFPGEYGGRRYAVQISDDGISSDWTPGTRAAYFFAGGDLVDAVHSANARGETLAGKWTEIIVRDGKPHLLQSHDHSPAYEQHLARHELEETLELAEPDHALSAFHGR